MQRRKTVYCEMAFLAQFENDRNLLSTCFDSDMIEKIQSYIYFQKFVDKSDLVFNASIDSFATLKESSMLIRTLWKKNVSGECNLTFKTDGFPDLKSDNLNLDDTQLNAIFLTMLDSDKCIEISKRFGVIVINPQMINLIPHVFIDMGHALPDPEINGWDFLSKHNKVFTGINISNAMILTDNYIVNTNKSDDDIERNLLKLLDIILPVQLDNNVSYELTIFSLAKTEQEKQKCKTFIGKIKKLREKKYHISASFILVDSADFHDRSIITNNIWISCGHGFDVFKRNNTVGQSTKVDVLYPFMQSFADSAYNAYYNLVDDANKVFERSHRYNFDYWGDEQFENRLVTTQKKKEQILARQQFSRNTEIPGIKILGSIPLDQLRRR